MSKREALQYSQRHYNEQTRRECRWPLSKEFLVKEAVRTAASELIGDYVENAVEMKDGTLYAAPKHVNRQKRGQNLRIVSISRRFVTLETT
jgi:hypothetical protein